MSRITGPHDREFYIRCGQIVPFDRITPLMEEVARLRRSADLRTRLIRAGIITPGTYEALPIQTNRATILITANSKRQTPRVTEH